MSKFKINLIRTVLGLSSLSDGKLASRGGAVVKGMTDNPAYPRPPVDMAVFKTAVDSYTTTIAAALSGGDAAIAARERDRVVVIRALRQLGHYVEANCNDDMVVFTSSGFQAVSTVRNPPKPLTQPDVRKIDQGLTGQLLVTITAIPGARTYELRYAALAGGIPGTWTTEVLTTAKGAAPINNLTPGTTYAFQARAVGRLGFTNWSDPTNRMCI